VLELNEPEYAALIGRLCASDRGQALAEVLADVETDPDDLTLLPPCRDASVRGRP
jgi:hypothetical protein